MYLKCGHIWQHDLNTKTFLCFHTSRQYQSFGDSRECPSNPHPSYRVYMKNSNHSPHPLEFPIPSMRGGRGCMDIIFWNHTYHFLCKSLMHTSGIATQHTPLLFFSLCQSESKCLVCIRHNNNNNISFICMTIIMQLQYCKSFNIKKKQTNKS